MATQSLSQKMESPTSESSLHQGGGFTTWSGTRHEHDGKNTALEYRDLGREHLISCKGKDLFSLSVRLSGCLRKHPRSRGLPYNFVCLSCHSYLILPCLSACLPFCLLVQCLVARAETDLCRPQRFFVAQGPTGQVALWWLMNEPWGTERFGCTRARTSSLRRDLTDQVTEGHRICLFEVFALPQGANVKMKT